MHSETIPGENGVKPLPVSVTMVSAASPVEGEACSIGDVVIGVPKAIGAETKVAGAVSGAEDGSPAKAMTQPTPWAAWAAAMAVVVANRAGSKDPGLDDDRAGEHTGWRHTGKGVGGQLDRSGDIGGSTTDRQDSPVGHDGRLARGIAALGEFPEREGREPGSGDVDDLTPEQPG